MDNKKVGTFIALRRKELGYNQKELAEKLNITDKAVSKWETGRSTPDVSMLIPLSNILEISVTELLNGEKIEKEELQIASDNLIVETMKPKKLNPLHIIAIIYGLIAINNTFAIFSFADKTDGFFSTFFHFFHNMQGEFETIGASIPILLVLSMVVAIGLNRSVSNVTTTLSICTNISPIWFIVAVFNSGINEPVKMSIISILGAFVLILTIMSLCNDAKHWNRYERPNRVGTIKKVGAIILYIMFFISICFYIWLSLYGASSILPKELKYQVMLFFSVGEIIMFPMIICTVLLLVVAFCTLIFYRKDFSKTTTILFSCGLLAFPIQFISISMSSAWDLMMDNDIIMGIYYIVVTVLFVVQLIATTILFVKDFRKNDFE